MLIEGWCQWWQNIKVFQSFGIKWTLITSGINITNWLRWNYVERLDENSGPMNVKKIQMWKYEVKFEIKIWKLDTEEWNYQSLR